MIGYEFVSRLNVGVLPIRLDAYAYASIKVYGKMFSHGLNVVI